MTGSDKSNSLVTEMKWQKKRYEELIDEMLAHDIEKELDPIIIAVFDLVSSLIECEIHQFESNSNLEEDEFINFEREILDSFKYKLMFAITDNKGPLKLVPPHEIIQGNIDKILEDITEVILMIENKNNLRDFLNKLSKVKLTREIGSEIAKITTSDIASKKALFEIKRYIREFRE